jgi:hypothetical protein
MEMKADHDQGPSLAAIQRWMQGVLIHPLGEEDAQPWAHLPAAWQQDPVSGLIDGSAQMSARHHLAIYQSSYLLRLRDCMAKQFTALEFALGPELFQHFADLYLQTHPSRSHTLGDLGRRFSQFLSATRPDADADEKETWPDFLIELAAFEYSVNQLFDAQAEPDDRNVQEADADTPDLQLRLRPVFQLFRHAFPIGSYYRAFIAGLAPELPLPQPSFTVVLRRNYRLGVVDVSEAQHYFLQYFLECGNSETAIQLLSQRHGLAANAVADAWQAWRREWIAMGLLRRA